MLSYLLHEPKEVLLNLPNLKRVRSEILHHRPDVVLLRSDFFAFTPLLVSRGLGLPAVLEVNSPSSESRIYFDQYLHVPLVTSWIEKWKLRAADQITTVSSVLRDHFVDLHDVAVDKFSVVPNGADLDRFKPQTSPDPEIASRISGGPIVGFVGSFEKWHGPELLREMVLRVAKARPESRFLLVGDGPGRKEVEEQLHSLASRVHFTGRVPHERIPGITALIDVAVMPESNFYGSPLKVIEWMAAGRAIVAPDYGPLCEVIESGKEGLLFRRGQAEDLAAAVIKLVDDPGLRQQLGRSAHRRAQESLSWSHNAARVIDACERAIESHSHKAMRAS